ncbi:MAG: hypothetical protein WCE94_13705 [Candidatus Methanoperedens sp.]
MFDIRNNEIREQKLKFIEILLVVGGIIGGLRFQNENDPMNILLGLFITGSLLYYFTISNPKIYSVAVSTFTSISIIIGTTFTSFCFSAIAILPFISRGIFALYPSFYGGLLYGVLIIFLWFFISIFTFKSLYD